MDLITIVSLIGVSSLIGGIAYIIRKIYKKGQDDTTLADTIDYLKSRLEGHELDIEMLKEFKEQTNMTLVEIKAHVEHSNKQHDTTQSMLTELRAILLKS